MLSFLGGPPPDDVKPVYSNKVGMWGSPQEIRLMFYLGSPGVPDMVVAEIIMSPMLAKGLSRYLPEKIKAWEDSYGVISMPEDKDLLESLFQVKLDGGPEGEPDGQE